MVLKGKKADESRTKFANIIRRYMAGDESLIREIQANAVSSSRVALRISGIEFVVEHLPDQIEDDSRNKFLQLIDDWKQQERILGKRSAPDLAGPVARQARIGEIAAPEFSEGLLAVSTEVRQHNTAMSQELASVGEILASQSSTMQSVDGNVKSIGNDVKSLLCLSNENRTLNEQLQASQLQVKTLEEEKVAQLKRTNAVIRNLYDRVKTLKEKDAEQSKTIANLTQKTKTPLEQKLAAMDADIKEIKGYVKPTAPKRTAPVVASQAAPTASSTAVVPATASQAMPQTPRPRPPDGRKPTSEMPKYSTFTPAKPA